MFAPEERSRLRQQGVPRGVRERGQQRPGEAQRWPISLWSTAAVVKAGHRLRLIVTSSDFPRYDRNPTTGEDPFAATDSRPALQLVFHSADRPSHLELPVIPA